MLALNAVGAALLGAELAEPGAPLAEVLAGQPELREILAAAVAEGTAPQRQECAVRSGPERRGADRGAHRPPAAPRRRRACAAYLVLFADLTEAQRRAEEGRLAESLAQLGEMAGGVAHELRNGLATLRGYLTLIERRPDEDSIADFLSEIRGEADHLRAGAPGLPLLRPAGHRPGAGALACRLLRRAAADPALDGVEVRVAAGREPTASCAATRSCSSGPCATCSTTPSQAEREAGGGGPVEVAVRAGDGGDRGRHRGPGPRRPAEIRERLFHPFATGRRGGVGLGLALAHRIVVLHGGRIRLEDRPGGGTRALLFFPRDTIVTMSNETSPVSEAPPGS